MDLAEKIPNSVVNVLTAISVIYAISKIYKKVKERVSEYQSSSFLHFNHIQNHQNVCSYYFRKK